MLNRSRRLALAAKMGLAGAIMCTTLVLSLGADVPSSSASSAFCKTLFSWEAISTKHETPSTSTPSGYHAWAKLFLPYYEKMASESSGKTKTALNDLVSIFKYYNSASSLAGIEAYIGVHHAKFTADVKALAESVESCA